MAEVDEGEQPAEIGRYEQERENVSEPSSFVAKMTGIVLVVPGIILYVYILYIMISKLVYPSSFSPFLAVPVTEPAENVTRDPELTKAILTDAALLWLFVFQHSLLACGALKRCLECLNMSAVSRPLYVFTTCLAIQFIHHYWLPTPAYALWQCESCLLHYVFLAVHFCSWVSIACSVFITDYLELLGIKQIYYSYFGFENPMHYKSEEQQYLLQHMRHPIFLAPTLVLWAVPIMTYDRLLVAVMVPLYLAWGSSIDRLDASYVKKQFCEKKKQLLVNGKAD